MQELHSGTALWLLLVGGPLLFSCPPSAFLGQERKRAGEQQQCGQYEC